MTRRRWIADSFTPATGHPTHAALTGDQALHLARVLRAQPGQIFDVVAAGFLHRAEITSVTPGPENAQVDFVLHEELESDSALPIHLYLAIFKFDHLEWAIEKATELGVQTITPILGRRTEKHLAQAAAKRVERWRRIAHEASQQSRRTSIPTIQDPALLKLALAAVTTPTRILLSETEQTLTLSQSLTAAVPHSSQPHRDEWDVQSRVPHSSQPHRDEWDVNSPNDDLALAIGPEGGWAPEEMTLFTQHRWTHVTLGPRILRAETAAIAAIAIAGTFLS
jgi:16S rRNA (uracil1498-N3)-methyltransferase